MSNQTENHEPIITLDDEDAVEYVEKVATPRIRTAMMLVRVVMEAIREHGPADGAGRDLAAQADATAAAADALARVPCCGDRIEALWAAGDSLRTGIMALKREMSAYETAIFREQAEARAA